MTVEGSDYTKLYEKSWELFKMELMVDSLGSMLVGEIIKEYLGRGYYLLKLRGTGDFTSVRFDRGEIERVQFDVKIHHTNLGSLFAFGSICHITVYKGVKKDLSEFFGGQIKEFLSWVGNPEPGVFLINQDGTSYFVGTTIYFNLKEHMDMDAFRIRPKGIIEMMDRVLEHISAVDQSLEVA